MAYEVEAFGKIIEVPDDVPKEKAYEQIMANKHKLGYDEFTDPANFVSPEPEALDYAKGFASGANKLVSGVGYLAEAAGANETGKAIREFGDRGAAYWNAQMSPGGKKAAESQVFVDDPESITGLRLGDDASKALLMGAAQSLPSMFAAALPGVAITKGIQALASLGLAGGAGATIPLLAGTAAPVGIGSQVVARVPSAIGFGAAEGVVSGGMNAAGLKSSIEGMSDKELLKSPVYQALRAQHGEEKARTMLADQAASDLFGKTAVSTGAIGALTGGGALGSAYQKVTSGAADGILMTGLKGAGQEAMQETPQSGGEKYIENITRKEYLDPSVDPMSGVIAEAASGGAIGAFTGGIVGAGSAINITKQKITPIADAPTLDDAIVAAHEAIRTEDPTLADVEALRPTQKETTNETQATIDAGQAQAAKILDIVLPDNSSVKAQWKIVDADQLAASMKEDVNQPRDRTRAASDVQIKSIANAPDYRRLSDSPVMDVGAPVVDQDGRIVAGNGRFAGLSQAYEQGTATEYMNQLREDAARKGLSIEGIAKPVLVRQLSEPVDTRKMAIASNSGTTLQMSALEQANLDAERMKGIENLDVNDLGDIALTPRNLTQLKDSLGSYVGTELGAMVDKGGQLSQEGMRRVRNAMLAKAYGSSPTLEKLVESTDSDMRNVLGALTKSANHIIKTKGDVKSLMEAVDTYSQLKATGQPVDNFLSQQDAFSEGLSKEAEGILRFIDTNVRSQKKLTDFFKGNFVEVDTTSDDMFEVPARHPNAKAASKDASWVIKNKATGEILFETFDKTKVDALNTSKYEAVPIYEHLTGLNKDERITKLEKHLKDAGYDFTVEPASVRDIDALDSTKKARKELAEKQAKLFKKKVVFVKADGPFKINGVMVPSIADTIFVDIRTDKAFDAIMAHELSHWMEQEKPAVYKAMIKSLKTVIIDEAEYAKKYGIEGATKAEITKEIVGDLMGDNFTEQSFWNKVAEANPKAFKDIAAAIIKWLKGVIVKAKANGMGSEQWVKDATKAQDIIAKAVAQYTESDAAPVSTESKPKFNVTGDNKSDIDKARAILNRLSDLYTRMMESKNRDLFGEFGERAVEAKDILASMLESGKLNGIGIEGKTLLSRNTSSKNPWRITFFSPVNGDPGGHNEFKTAKEALRESDLIVRSKDKDKIALFSRAYHGSPHDHNKFESSKIGTGEGAQAYGYGHYFAESKDVAEFYRKNLSNDSRVTSLTNRMELLRVGNDKLWDRYDIEPDALLVDQIGDGAIDAAVEHAEDRLERWVSLAADETYEFRDYASDKVKAWTNLMPELKAGNVTYAGRGKLYEVELAPEQDEYLLWDKPLSEQSDKVKSALGEGGIKSDEVEAGKLNARLRTLNRLIDSGGAAAQDAIKDKQSLLDKLDEYDPDAEGADIYKKLSSETGGDKKASEYLHSLGIRGIKYLDGSSRAKGEGAYNYVIFDDKDVSITAKFSKAAVENTLIAQHNLSVRNLIHADRMGGLAAPSIAVTDKAHPLTGFGEITLLSHKDLIDPKNGTKIFGSDIYSPRYPSISYDFSGKPIKALNALLAKGVTATGDSEYYNDNLQNDPFRELTHSSAAMYTFLSEQGVEPELAYVKPRDLPDQRLMKFVDERKDSFDLSNDDEFKATAKAIFADKSDRADTIDEQGLGYITRDYANQVVAHREAIRNAGKVDRQATNTKLFRQISDSNLRNKFDEYLVDLVNKAEPKEKIFKGYTNAGNRQYMPHDIDTVIKILKKDLRGGENFKYGLGSIRAKYSPQFKSIEQIRKSKGMLMDSESFDQVKKEVQAGLDGLNESLASYGTFSGYDNVETMLSDAAKRGISGALKDNGFENVPDSIKVDIQTFLNKLKDMPTEYFEAKILRAVGLGEFSTAVIPDDSTPQVEAILKKNGIEDIRKYKSGDNEDRVKQINKVTHVMFSRAPKLYSKLEQALEAANDKIFSTGPQVRLWLQSNVGKLGIKKDEIYWSGIDNWLDAQGKVSKQQVVEFVRNNGVQVEDVTLGGDQEFNAIRDKLDRMLLDELEDRPVDKTEQALLEKQLREIKNTEPKHNNDKLTLPGGSNYKELVVTVPTIEPHNVDDSTHFGDTGGGRSIGWLRMDTRDGGLFIEELQSQRAQQGRSKGFDVVPPAPFVSDANNKATNAYITLLMKKALIEAVSNDHASVSWTTGDQQADRYDLSKQINMASAISNNNGTYNLIVEDKSGNEIDPYSRSGKRVTPAEMEEVIGKDLTKKVVAGADLVKDKPWPKSASTNPAFYTVRGVDLKVGGEWAQSMYGNDQGLNLQGKPSLISQAANDIFKHVGSGKVESINGQPGFYVTPEMKSKDLPLFSFAGPKAETADKYALETAQQRIAAGDPDDTVRRETGWFKGVDGKWRFEINDSDAKLTMSKLSWGTKEDIKQRNSTGSLLSEVLDHPKLYAAYPSIKNYWVQMVPGMKGASFQKDDNIIVVGYDLESSEINLSNLLHEIQHGIQYVEGFAIGGSPKAFARDLPDGGYDNGYDQYRRLAGEVEARNTQSRLGMSESERKAVSPGVTQDVPDSDQIIVYNGVEMRSEPDTINIDGVERPTTNSEGKAINNPVNFWKWFGDSEARQWPKSSRGDRAMAPPLVLYHGTKGDFNEFVVGSPGTNSTVFGPWETKRAGMFFTQDKKFAESFATQGDSTQGANILPVYLKVKNAIDLTEGFTDDAIIDALAEKGVNPRLMRNVSADQIWGMFDEEDDGSFFVSKLKELGYDGAIIVEPNNATEDSAETWVVFDPNQIKSAIGNNGDYSTTNNDIRFSRAPNENLTDAESKLIVDTFNANSDPKVNKVWQVEDSSNIRAKSVAFQKLAEQEGYEFHRDAAGEKYFWIKKKGDDTQLNIRVSDHSNVNRGQHFGDVDINLATDDGEYPIDTFASALHKMRNATVNEDGDTVIDGKDLVKFSKDVTPPVETRLRRFQRMNQDSFNRFTVIKEWLADNGQKLSDKADVYGAEERYHSMAANQLEDFREQQRNPLIEKIQKAGYTLGDIEVFLKMQHAREANAQIRKLGDNPDATAYGIEDQEAADYLAEAPEKLATLANEFHAITEQTKQLRLDAGILNTDITDAWEGAYKHYVPVKGEADSTRGVGKGLKTNFKSKRRLGHSLRDEHVIENILMDHERAILEVERNRVGKHLVMMAAEMQRPDILSIDQPEKRKMLKESTAYTVEANGVVQGVFKSREEAKMFKQFYAASMPKVAPSAIVINQTKDQRVIASASPMLAENEVNVYMNGHAIRVQINDELLARAYTKMGVEQFSDIVGAGRILNGYLSKVYTGYNPEFILTNMIRDFSSGTINLTGEQGFGMATKALTNYPRMFTDLLKYAATNGKSSTKWIDAYRKNGGNTGAAYLSDMERLGNEVNTEYASYQGVLSNLKQGDNANAARAAGRKVFNATLKWIYNLNQAGENAMRLAAFKAMIDSGRTVNEAAKVAKNITVNFNRKGERQWAPALYLFYNASVQGTAATAHALGKGKHKGQAWALAGSMAAVGYMMAASFGGGGTEDDWDEINDYTKERNMLIKYGDGYVKVPVPYGYGFFWNFGRHMSEAQRTGELGAIPWHLATSAISEFTPFNDVVVGSDEEFRSDQVFMGLLPTAMKIVAQPTFNKQLFSGSELMPESQFDKSQPDRQKMFRSTKGTMYDEVAGWLDSAGIDVSPETLKYITRTGTGGAGSLVDTGISAAMLKAEGAELDTQEIPFVRKAYMELGIKDKRAAYYKVREEARTAAEEFNRARRGNDVAKMQDVLKDKKELIALDRYANKLAATIDAARDQQDAVRADKNLSVQEKRLKLKDMEATEAKFYDQYLDVFKTKTHRK